MSTLKGIGHDLSKLIMEIKRRELGENVAEMDCSVIRMMNPDYKNRRYSYAMGGHKYNLVVPPRPYEVAERLSDFAIKVCM